MEISPVVVLGGPQLESAFNSHLKMRGKEVDIGAVVEANENEAIRLLFAHNPRNYLGGLSRKSKYIHYFFILFLFLNCLLLPSLIQCQLFELHWILGDDPTSQEGWSSNLALKTRVALQTPAPRPAPLARSRSVEVEAVSWISPQCR